jgi:ribosomal protein L40E
MGEYPEAKKSEKTNKETHSDISKTQTKLSGQKANICPNCNTPNPEEAAFCSECGSGLGQPLFCPNCGDKTFPGADICQGCRTWLLEGQCKFCYAKLSPDAIFCPECGNPKDGIPCPNCGRLSIFDFCTNCGKPITEGALEALKHAKDDPEAQALLNAIEQNAAIESELAEIEALLASEPEIEPELEPEDQPPPPARKSLFSDRQIASIMKTGADMEAAAQRNIEGKKETERRQKEQEERVREAEEKARKKALEQPKTDAFTAMSEKIAEEKAREEALARQRAEAKARKEALERQRAAALAAMIAAAKASANRRFNTHQEARRWYMANRHPNAAGWLCNYSGTVHPYPEGPGGCAEPGMGGRDYFAEEG